MKLLLAEDERELLNALCAILRHNGYDTDAAADGNAAWNKYDAVILDIMMPGIDGMEILRNMRDADDKTPVLMLTAKTGIQDRIQGLDCGADDYLTKPFDTGELLARIRSITRRGTKTVPDTLSFEDLILDKATYTMKYNGKSVLLSSKEYNVIELLMMHPGQMISSEMFMDRIWGYEKDIEINVVWVYMSHLRKKLAQICGDIEIKGLRGRGYMLARK